MQAVDVDSLLSDEGTGLCFLSLVVQTQGFCGVGLSFIIERDRFLIFIDPSVSLSLLFNFSKHLIIYCC